MTDRTTRKRRRGPTRSSAGVTMEIKEMTDFKASMAMALASASHFEPSECPTRKRRKKRAPNLAGALKLAAKAGAGVSAATIAPDGSVTLEFGKDQPKPEGANPWLVGLETKQ